MRCYAPFSTCEAAGYDLARYLPEAERVLAAGSRHDNGGSNTIGKIEICYYWKVDNV